MELIEQPGHTTAGAIASAISPDASGLDVAVAYATFSGFRELVQATGLSSKTAIRKRFLVGVDWFRSEPTALEGLARLSGSELRVFDGSYLVTSERCQPRRTFHPKAYFIKRDGGSSPGTLIVGSANLSRNGLRSSVELSVSTDEARLLSAFQTWFDREWSSASPWTRIASRYKDLYPAGRTRAESVTDEDSIADPDVLRRIRWVKTPDRLRLVRSAQNLWIDVGHLHNRHGLPGTNLQFSQMTRVFFGCDPVLVPGNTHLADVTLSIQGGQSQTRPLVYNRSSSMDRLSLPIPGENGWPQSYDDETLLFTKVRDGTYRVKVATGNDRSRWRRQSNHTGIVVPMQRGSREWGVF